MHDKKDEDGQCAAALRSVGMNLDALAMELILTLTDKVRHNRNEGRSTSLEELLTIKKDIEEANKPAPQQGMPQGMPPGMPPLPMSKA
jgi:hypothetical protein